MATAPKCRLCGTPHWHSQPCAGAPGKQSANASVNKPANTVSKPVNTPPPVNAAANTEIAALRARVSELEQEVERLRRELARTNAPRIDRKTYMREYMRKKRAVKGVVKEIE